MAVVEGIICLAIPVTLLSVGWFFPRKLGVIGIIIAHVVITLLTIVAELFDFIRGVVPDPDFIWLIGNIFWVMVANLLLLPLTIIATYRHYYHKRMSKKVG